MPQNERSLQRHERSHVLRNEAWSIVCGRAIGRNNDSVCEEICRTNEAFATTHGLRNGVPVILRRRVEFDPHGIGIDIVKKSLNLK